MLISAHPLTSRLLQPWGTPPPGPALSLGTPHGCWGQVWGRSGGGLGEEGGEVAFWEVRGWGGGSPAPPSPLERASRGSGSVTAPLWGYPSDRWGVGG